MAIVHEHAAHEHYHDYPERRSGNSSFLVGVIILIVLAFLLYYYGLPAIRSFGGGGTQVNIPDRINVNVQTPQNGGGAPAPQK